MKVLAGGMHMRGLVDWVAEEGAAFESQALTAEALEAVQEDVARLQWTPQFQAEDPWLQYSDALLKGEDLAQLPGIAAVREALEREVREQGGRPGLESYEINDIKVQHYEAEVDGIATHQDYTEDRYLVMALTVVGGGPFELLTARRGGTVWRRFETIPGSLVLLWAPGLTTGDGDRRPAHRTLHPPVERVSIGLRQIVGTKLFRGEQRDRGALAAHHDSVECDSP